MKFYLASADVDAVREAEDLGILDGVVVTPSLLRESGTADVRELLFRIGESMEGDVWAPVSATSTDELVEEGHGLAQTHDRVTVQIPTTRAGIRAIGPLRREGISTCATLCHTASQAVAAAHAGADAVSIPTQSLETAATDSVEVVARVADVFATQHLEADVVAASVESPHQVEAVAAAGGGGVIVPLDTLYRVIDHPLTERAHREQQQHWQAYRDARKAEAGM